MLPTLMEWEARYLDAHVSMMDGAMRWRLKQFDLVENRALFGLLSYVRASVGKPCYGSCATLLTKVFEAIGESRTVTPGALRTFYNRNSSLHS